MPTACPLKALYVYFCGCLIDSASKCTCCRHSWNFRFGSCYHHYKGVKPFQKGVTEGNDP